MPFFKLGNNYIRILKDISCKIFNVNFADCFPNLVFIYIRGFLNKISSHFLLSGPQRQIMDKTYYLGVLRYVLTPCI